MTMDILLTGAVSIVSAMIGGGISYLAQSAQDHRKNAREDFQAFFRAYAVFTAELNAGPRPSHDSRCALLASIEALRMTLPEEKQEPLKAMFDVVRKRDIDSHELSVSFDALVRVGHDLFSQKRFLVRLWGKIKSAIKRKRQPK